MCIDGARLDSRKMLDDWELPTCIKAVAMITPDPKYLAMKKASAGTRMRFDRERAIGSSAPG